MKLFSHPASRCAQLMFGKIIVSFFGGVPLTTEWTFRVFTMQKTAGNADGIRVFNYLECILRGQFYTSLSNNTISKILSNS